MFYVNWFRKDDNGKFMWPGYGENSRVLAWIFGRVTGEAEARGDPDRARPADRRGRDRHRRPRHLATETMARLLEVDTEGWLAQLPQMKEHYAEFGDKLPTELRDQLEALEQRLGG